MIIAYYILLTAFYIVYFAKQLMSKRQGITTNQLGKRDKPLKNSVIEKCLFAISIAMGISQYTLLFFQETLKFPPALIVLGLILMMGAVMMFVLSVTTMKNNWRAGIEFKAETKLVTTGIYSLSRNPAFLAFNFLYWGSWLVVGHPLLLLLSLLGTVFFHLQILLEESYLSNQFKQDYLVYCSLTSRYLTFKRQTGS